MRNLRVPFVRVPPLVPIREIEVKTDTTTVTITELDVNRDRAYLLIIIIKNPTGSTSNYYLFVEGDTILTNYYTQYLDCDGTAIGAGRWNMPNIAVVHAGDNALLEVLLTRDVDGYARFTSRINRRPAASIRITIQFGAKTAPVTNITRIDIVSAVTNAIGVGSKILIYAIGGGYEA